MKIVDANIILRYLLNDTEELAEKATEIIENNKVLIPMENIEMPNNVREYFESGSKKIKKVTANEDYTLTIHFNNDEIKLYDMSGMLYGVLEILKDKDKFKEVFIDEFGNIAWDIDKEIDSSVHWNNRIDLCKDSVYLESKPLN